MDQEAGSSAALHVTKRSAFSLRAAFTLLVIVAALLLAGDVIYRNEQAGRLIHAIEGAEAVLVGYQRDAARGYDLELDEIRGDYQVAVDRVSDLTFVGAYSQLTTVRDAYLEHAQAWLQSFEDQSDTSVDAVNASWTVFCETAERAIPYVDYAAVERSLIYVKARGGCPSK